MTHGDIQAAKKAHEAALSAVSRRVSKTILWGALLSAALIAIPAAASSSGLSPLVPTAAILCSFALLALLGIIFESRERSRLTRAHETWMASPAVVNYLRDQGREREHLLRYIVDLQSRADVNFYRALMRGSRDLDADVAAVVEAQRAREEVGHLYHRYAIVFDARGVLSDENPPQDARAAFEWCAEGLSHLPALMALTPEPPLNEIRS